MAVTALTIADVLIASLNNLGRLKFTDLMSDYQNTIALKRIFRKNKAQIESGAEVQFNIINDENHSARHAPLGYITRADIPNLLSVGKMPWRHTTWNWAMERRIVAMNQGSSRIIDMANAQRLGAFASAIILFERTMWRVPTAGGEEEQLNPVGLPYFIVKSATAATQANNNGFNGNVPSGYTKVANITPSTDIQGRYQNYADAYTEIEKNDLVKKMRRAFYYTDFTPLMDDIPQYDLGNDYGIYTNYAVVGRMEEILEGQNEKLGNDVAPMDGKVMFRRTPITPVIELDRDTTNPVYGVNWGVIGAKGLKGEWMYEQNFKAEASQPTVNLTNTDCSWNMFCQNRRKLWVISNGTTMPG